METKSNSQKLINGTMLYFVATFISKSMSLLMLHFITREIATEAYGYYDVIISLIPLLLPIFTVQSIEAIFRFLFDADEMQKKQLLSNLWVVVFFGNLAAFLIMISFNAFIFQIRYMAGFYLYYVVSVLLNMYQRVARSYGKSKMFAISGIINSLFMVIFQLISLYGFYAGVNGLLYSYVLAGFLACVYLEFHTKSLQQFRLRYIQVKQIKKLISFGLPLVPNNISWWASSSINRLIIITVISQNASGLFGIANKFSSILAMLTGVFQLAWQESAITSYNSKERSKYYTKVYSKYFLLLFGGCCLGLPLIKICFPLLVSESYRSVWIIIPLLLFGTGASSMSMFYGAGYIASQKTKDAFWTTIEGAVINILLCVLLIKPFGLFAPAISSLVACLVVWIVRHITMKKYFEIKIEFKWIFIVFMMGVFSVSIYYFAGSIANGLGLIVILIIMIFSNQDFIRQIKSKALENKKEIYHKESICMYPFSDKEIINEENINEGVTNLQMSSCTGCGACANICPVQSIQMKEDKDGFLYPCIDYETCTKCGLCNRVCPINKSENIYEKKNNNKNKKSKREEPQALAAYSLDDKARELSSSGGIFYLLAKTIISRKGVVCGVELDENFKVKHSCSDKLEEIQKYRESKYVQSEIGTTFRQIRNYLREEKEVIFTGTPCQVAGLRSFLGKEYKNLIYVDCLCFGVPSPLAFRQYLKALKLKKGKSIQSIHFRSKVNGWTGKRFSFAVKYADGDFVSEIITKNAYHRTFFGGLNARKSCYFCQYKSPLKPGDLTLADFWGVEKLLPGMDDGKGTSLIFINTHKGRDFLEEVKSEMKCVEIEYQTAIQYNQAAIVSLPYNKKREKFFKEIRKDSTGKKTLRIMKKYTHKSWIVRGLHLINRKLFHNFLK